jgi:nitrile hydratase accessory protein
MYERRRNLVRRSDGRLVNVARPRGQLFVCHNTCCCGRTEDGFAPVPVALYHAEWERRRLRNIVHLTIGGCLGPCALANVALLLFDGQALWFHSMNDAAAVLALYDYVEDMLDADRVLPPPSALAARQFTASAWQARPDGQPVDDVRPRRRTRAGAALPRPRCPVPAEAAAVGERLVADMEGAAAAPRRNGELVFAAPWEGRAFGMAVALHERGLYSWEEFRDRLIARIAAADARGDPSGYYERWLAAFEDLLAATGLVTREELDERTYEFEFGERDDVF